MTADRTTRLSEIGAVLAERMPSVLDAAIALLESIPPVLDPARPERYEITRQIGTGGQAEVLLATVRGAEGFHRLVAVKRVRSDQVNAAKAVMDLSRGLLSASRRTSSSDGKETLSASIFVLFVTSSLPSPARFFLQHFFMRALRASITLIIVIVLCRMI